MGLTRVQREPKPWEKRKSALPFVDVSTACIPDLVSADRAMGLYITHESGSALNEEDHIECSLTMKRKTDKETHMKRPHPVCLV
jgi:hypothetical protein